MANQVLGTTFGVYPWVGSIFYDRLPFRQSFYGLEVRSTAWGQSRFCIENRTTKRRLVVFAALPENHAMRVIVFWPKAIRR